MGNRTQKGHTNSNFNTFVACFGMHNKYKRKRVEALLLGRAGIKGEVAVAAIMVGKKTQFVVVVSLLRIF